MRASRNRDRSCCRVGLGSANTFSVVVVVAAIDPAAVAVVVVAFVAIFFLVVAVVLGTATCNQAHKMFRGEKVSHAAVDPPHAEDESCPVYKQLPRVHRSGVVVVWLHVVVCCVG